MKLRYWVGIWSAILAFCIILCVCVRASYTNFSADWNGVSNALYSYQGGTGGSFFVHSNSYGALAGKSRLAAQCEFTGKREAQNMCWLSDVRVVRVYKGDKSLEGSVIRVYEPVDTHTGPIIYLSGSSEYQQYVKKFGPGRGSSAVASRNYYTNGFSHSTMFKTGCRYLLFLNLKQYPKELDSSKKLPCYKFLDNPYAKLSIGTGVTAANYKSPPEIISLKESLGYEILLSEKKSIRTFFSTKKSVLSYLGLK